ncbi:RNA polymerase sigma factor [Dyadobacter pollutisoli]|uniref:Sigma-70 family RNA polymerase sigma factor n=1 Tax=Dyadobacter pollutisoli TaxID=2910158 RepID=A0A9E8N941_9BACT|nr:sigma-70 family RNA polymerase sigma factor [Dyadobacter pollutisoli]WAC10149.1 sigma-70 family RNA polymerase sigma factor [Dyadobacter pollutisoli]
MITEIGSPDFPLIQAIKNGNEKALGLFYKENFGKILHLVLKNSGSNDDAQDVYQESMMEVVLQIRKDKLDQLTSKLSTYLYSICYYKWIDRLRQRGKMVASGFDEELEAAVLEDDDTSPYMPALEKVLGQIGEKCMMLLQAFYYDKLSMSQIAAKLGFADDNSAKSQKNKCMDKARFLGKNVLKQLYS